MPQIIGINDNRLRKMPHNISKVSPLGFYKNTGRLVFNRALNLTRSQFPLFKDEHYIGFAKDGEFYDWDGNKCTDYASEDIQQAVPLRTEEVLNNIHRYVWNLQHERIRDYLLRSISK